MLNTKIFDTHEVIEDRFDSIDTTTDFFKSSSFLSLLTILLTIVIAFQAFYLLKTSLPIVALITSSAVALSYFYSLRLGILLFLGLYAFYGLGTGLGTAFATNHAAPIFNNGFFVIQILIALGAICLAAYTRFVKTNIKWQSKIKEFTNTHDDLTALLNKESFLERLDNIINESSNKQERFALVLIDINGLQRINQRHGYKAGNAALHVISNRLRQVAQKDDLIARIEDGCFALVVRNMAHNAQLKSYIARVKAMLNLPFDYGWKAISLHTKVSSSFYPLDGKTASELLDLNLKKLG